MAVKKIHTVAIVYNLKKSVSGLLDDTSEEYDEWETIEVLRDEIKKCGLKVVTIEQNENIFKKFTSLKIDFVFNIAEGLGSYRSRESQVPCFLESQKIPYSGSDAIALGITLDKFFCSYFLKSQGIKVPLMYSLDKKENTSYFKNIFKDGKRFIVKPRWEGSSKGIFLNSVVSNYKDLNKRVAYIISKYRQPAVVEEFIEGDEITVGILGNDNPKVITMMKISLKDEGKESFIYSIENKRFWKERILYSGHNEIEKIIREKISEPALSAFKCLSLRDIARVDFRLNKIKTPFIIDVNPLPGLSPHYSDLPIAYKLGGGSYSDLIKKILKTALKRYGFKF